MKRRAALGILILVLVFDVLAVVLVYATALRAPAVHLDATPAAVALFQVPPVVDGMPQIIAAASDRGTYFWLMSTFLLMAYSLYKDRRNRKWDLEDRAAARADLKQHQVEAAVLLAKGVRNSKEEVLQKIEENTSLTNNLNTALIGKKGCTVGATLAAISAALEETKAKVEETKATVEEAKAVSTDTNVIVSKAAADLLASSDDANKEGPA